MNEHALRISADLEPVPWARPRASRNGGFHTAKKPAAYIRALTLLAASAWAQTKRGEPLEGPVRVEALFVRSRPKRLMRRKDPAGELPAPTLPDIDNYLKAVMDALTKAGIWKDDGQVVEVIARKHYAAKDGQPRVEVTVWEVEG